MAVICSSENPTDLLSTFHENIIKGCLPDWSFVDRNGVYAYNIKQLKDKAYAESYIKGNDLFFFIFRLEETQHEEGISGEWYDEFSVAFEVSLNSIVKDKMSSPPIITSPFNREALVKIGYWNF